MSFFGFDTTLPRDRPQGRQAPGFGALQDAFAGLDDGAETKVLVFADLSGRLLTQIRLDFEDTYEGYGAQLDDNADELNDDTFGASAAPATQQSVGRDFDFGGHTDNVAQAMEEERMRYFAQHAPSRLSPSKQSRKPARTGYEVYQHKPVGDLVADDDIWGLKPKQSALPPVPSASSSRKPMTLEEVEAMMLQQAQQQSQSPMIQQPPPPRLQYGHQAGNFPLLLDQQRSQQHHQSLQQLQAHPSPPPFGVGQATHPTQILQRPPTDQQQEFHRPSPGPSHPQQYGSVSSQPPASYGSQQTPQIMQREKRAPQSERPPAPSLPRGPRSQQYQQMPSDSQGHNAPRQILQNPNRLSGHGQPIAPPGAIPTTGRGHSRGPSYSGPLITNPTQILRLSEAERSAYLEDEARRAKRNHKIQMLAKDNGVMTPSDKNFITRIQLQSLVTATGNVDAQGPEAVLNEDFYYQVYAQIRGAPRQNPQQPANQFAQTYLFQTGGRFAGGRRHPRGGDNHMQRMEQQVARAVEAARAKPKNKQLVIEGSLGKISFSNAKTPKPLLNIKRTESEQKPNTSARRQGISSDRRVNQRTTLRDVEQVYSALMHLEDHERQMPPDETEASSAWHAALDVLNQRLWQAMKIDQPIGPGILHPFIAMLSHSKGKRALPRVFRHLNEKQRITMVTMILVSLDSLDVIANALIDPIPSKVKEDIELFLNAILPLLIAHINDAPANIVTGLLGLVIERTDLRSLIRTRAGLSILTVLLSRAEFLAQENSEDPIWQSYQPLYLRLFETIEPLLPHLFPDSNPASAEDVYVWQFLAAMGVGASARPDEPELAQRLVLGVKERVNDTVGAARTLPASERERRLAEVNLFMVSLGLDVELLVR